MEPAVPVLVMLCCAAAFAAGWRVGGMSLRAGAAGASAALALIALRVLFRFLPEWEWPLFRWGFYPAVQLYWAFPAVIFALGIGARRWSVRAIRPACAAAAVVFCALAVIGAGASPAAGPTTRTSDGVVLQSADHTCGPAAAATLLGELGVPAGEAEMARLCGSAAWLGTTEGALCRALQRKLGPTAFGAALERPDEDRLCRYIHPVLARLRAGVLRDHWVVLLAINDRVAILGDLALGKVEMPAAEFLRVRRDVAIVVDKAFLLPD